MDLELKNRIDLFDEMTKDIIDKDFRQYLIDHGYFIAPASTKYHGDYEGGLFEHSLSVMSVLMDLSVKNKLKWLRPCSPFIIGLFHDLCKIDNYVLVHDLATDESSYKYNTNVAIPGHGDKSVMLLSQHMKLTEEEIMCIRYHMGAFTDKEEWNYYTRAVKRYPNVLWTHHADMIASQIMCT